jgi:hypothetical protein
MAPTKHTLETISKRPTKRPSDVFNGKLKSDVTSWKQAVKTHYDPYLAECLSEDYKMDWLVRICKDKVLHCHEARVQEVRKREVQENWLADRQVADAELKSGHEIT